MLRDREVRREIVRQNHLLFFHFYFAHYVKYETAEFQKDIFALTEDEGIKFLLVVSFRGSAKSTIITLSYTLWAILGKQAHKFILILCQTRTQAKQHMVNIKRELESNELLKNDLGPFQEDSDEWGTATLVFTKLNARISIASREQSIRGLRHNQYRPSLIIGDDLEDMDSTRTKESRDKTYQWLTSEVIPAGDQNTRLVLVGNLLHEDSLLMRLKQDIENGKVDGVFKEYPLIDKDGVCLWPGKYSAKEDLIREERKVGNDIAWQREFLLKIVPSEGQLIFPEKIRYYDRPPGWNEGEFRYSAIGIDLAISSNNTADCTAMVTAHIYGYGPDLRIYIQPHPVNKRLSFYETKTLIRAKALTTVHNDYPHIYVEDVAYQRVLIEELQRGGLPFVQGVKVHGQDKRARLALTTPLIESGKVLFPKEGAEDLIRQLVGFGVEKHDDLADAFAILLLKIIEADHGRQEIVWF